MPTATLSPCFDWLRRNRLPPERVWVPVSDLSTALSALELLRSQPPAAPVETPKDQI